MSLKFRIAATIFALEVIVISAVLWITLGHSNTAVREQIGHADEVTIHLIADLSRAALLTDEYAELQTFIESTQRDPRIKSVIIANARGQVVAATAMDSIGAPIPALENQAHRYWQEREIRGRASPLGSLAIEFSDYPLLLAHQEARNLGVSIAVGGMLLIAVVGLVMGFVLTRRLAGLAHAADRVAAGDLSHRLDSPGRDEVARLGRAFNSMVGRLADNLDALKAARDRLILPTEAMSEGFALWDSDDRLVLHNGRLRELFHGMAGHIVPGARFEDLCRLAHADCIAPDEPEAAWLARRLAHHHDPQGYWETRLQDGRWLAISEFRTREGGTVTIYTDVTVARQRALALEHGEQRLRAIMDAVIDGILTTDENGVVQSANPAAGRVFGRLPGDLVGCWIEALLGAPPLVPDAPCRSVTMDDLPSQRLLELVGRRNDGSEFPVEVSRTDLALQGRRNSILTVRDITARKAADELVLFHATHDALTGLPNRALFDDRLASALEHAARRDEQLAVLFLDLDRFKLINDTLGHSIGDALLTALGRRLSACVRSEDTVARMGGDEFMFILRGVRSGEDAIKPATKILQAIRPAFHLRGHELHVTASIGISLYPTDGLGPDQLLKAADMALYRAKERGRNRLQLYNPTLNARVHGQMVLEKHLRRALEAGQFSLVYQPQVVLDTGKVAGVEALLRWHHPELGTISPTEFVPLAEDNGLIEPLGLWVLCTACEAYRGWHQARRPGLRLAVNLSARQFQRPGLDQRILEVLEQTGMDPRDLELELTESALMQEGEGTARVLARLAAQGIGLALDDFGTGYASLGYLKRFPIRRIKIDRSFVRDIHTSSDDAALARAVIAMAHGLEIEVLAEGIETLEQLTVLRGWGCDEGQGDLLGRPMAGAEIARATRPAFRDSPRLKAS